MNALKIEIPILDDIIVRLEKIESVLNSIKGLNGQSEKGWLNTKQAAQVLGVTPRTLQTYRDSKIIDFSQFGREVRFRADDLQEFLMAHYVKSNSRKGGQS